MKRSTKIIIIIVVLVLLGIFAFFLWKNFIATPATPTVETTQGTTTPGTEGATTTSATGTLPPTAGTIETLSGNVPGATYTITRLSDGPASAFWVSKTSGSAFYLSSDGSVMLAKEGVDQLLSKQKEGPVISATPSQSGDRALIAFGDPNSPNWAIFDTIDKVWRPLPSGIRAADWAGTEDKIVCVYKTSGKTSLITINLLKTPFEEKTIVSNFVLQNITIATRSASDLFVSEKPSAYYNSRIWQINIANGTTTLALGPQGGLYLKWGNAKDVAFKFASPSSFSIIDNKLSETSPLNVVTVPSKCDGTLDAVYCFVPNNRSLWRENVFPDEYFMNKVYTVDSLYRIDPGTGETSLVMTSNNGSVGAIDAKNVSVYNASTFFMNKYNDYLYVVTNNASKTANTATSTEVNNDVDL